MKSSKLASPGDRMCIRALFALLIGLYLSSPLYGQDTASEEIEVLNGPVSLPGTLRFPEGGGPHPLLIFIPGSGNIDRNGNQAGTMVQAGYIRQLGEAIASRNLAFYSYDKRTAAAENKGRLDTVLLTDYVSDVQTLVDYFENDPRFDGIHLLGHSQGSLVGMLSLSRKSPVRSLVSIAGPASPIDSILMRQLSAQNPDLGREASEHLDHLKKGQALGEVSPMLRPLFSPANRPLLKEWMGYHPVEVFAEITVPALLVYGEEDTQVSPDAGRRLLNARPDSKMVEIPRMNHVLKELEAPSDNLRAYTDPNMPVSPQLVREVIDFINKVR